MSVTGSTGVRRVTRELTGLDDRVRKVNIGAVIIRIY